MQTRSPLILLLVLAVVCVDLVAVSLVCWQPYTGILWPHPILGVFLALVCAQVSLVTTWVGLARRPVPWPVAAAVVVVVALGALLGLSLSGRIPSYWFGPRLDWLAGLSLQTLAVVGPLWIARLAGLRVVTQEGLRSAAKTDSDRPVQFSIAYLLGWMTALAIVLGSLRWVLGGDMLLLSDASWPVGHAWLEVAVFSLGNAAIAWPAPWAVLGARRRIAGTLMLCLAAGGLLAVYLLVSGSTAHRWTFAVFCAVQVAVLVAVLGVFRVAGYRLVRHPKRRNEECRV